MSRGPKNNDKTPEVSGENSVSLSVARASVDQDLMRRVGQGDQKAFRHLFDHYKVPIVDYLYHMVQNQRLAEDLAQEAFLKVYRFRESYDHAQTFSTWLWTIARNTALDHFRAQSGARGDAASDPESELESIADPAASSEEKLVEQVDREQLAKCISGLTVSQRDALMLRTESELSYDEIATQLGLKLQAVASLINRAKAALSRCLRECGRSHG